MSDLHEAYEKAISKKPVFCTNCVHFKPTDFLCGGELPIPTKYKCWAKAQKVNRHNAVTKWTMYLGIVPCDKRNKKNNCPLYKRVWWKLWLG